MNDRLAGMLREIRQLGVGRVPCEAMPRAARQEYNYRHSHGPLMWTEGGHEYRAEYIVDRTQAGINTFLYASRDGFAIDHNSAIESLERLEVE